MIKFSCEKVFLQNAIAVTSRAVAQKSSIPALEGLLLHADQQLTHGGMLDRFDSTLFIAPWLYLFVCAGL